MQTSLTAGRVGMPCALQGDPGLDSLFYRMNTESSTCSCPRPVLQPLHAAQEDSYMFHQTSLRSYRFGCISWFRRVLLILRYCPIMSAPADHAGVILYRTHGQIESAFGLLDSLFRRRSAKCGCYGIQYFSKLQSHPASRRRRTTKPYTRHW